MLSKKSLSIIAVIVLVLLIIILVIKSQDRGSTVQTNNSAPVISKSKVPDSQLPSKFPADLPIEVGAVVIDNYNATTPDGRFQATRSFETSESLAANLKLYTNYLKTEGWTIQATVDKLTYKMVVGKKENQQLQISIDQNASSKTKTVTISLTEFQWAQHI